MQDKSLHKIQISDLAKICWIHGFKIFKNLDVWAFINKRNSTESCKKSYQPSVKLAQNS